MYHMSRRIDLLGSVRNVLGGLFGVLRYLCRFAWLMLVPKAVLAAELLAAQSQLTACVDAVNRKQAPKPRFTLSFRLTFHTLYVFVILEHGRRKIRHWATAHSPTMQWVIQQLRNAMPFDEKPRFLHRDNDGIYGPGVPTFLSSCGIEQVRTAYHCPWQNPYVERSIGTLRRELPAHVIPLSQSHLERLLREFIEDYYHGERPHQGLGGETPVRREAVQVSGPTRLVSVPVLCGLHHVYRRVAA